MTNRSAAVRAGETVYYGSVFEAKKGTPVNESQRMR